MIQISELIIDGPSVMAGGVLAEDQPLVHKFTTASWKPCKDVMPKTDRCCCMISASLVAQDDVNLLLSLRGPKFRLVSADA